MLPHLDLHATEANQLETIHPEYSNGCLARWRQTDNFRGIVVSGEVIFPPLLLRVKQGNALTCKRSNGTLSMGFLAVTGGTSQTEIFKSRFTASTAGHDVLDFKARYRKRLACPTIAQQSAIVHEVDAAMRQGRMHSRRVQHTWLVSEGIPRPGLEDG
jgi:hypothetical protein